MIWATALGNGIATYDFTVYSFFAVHIGRLYFPSQSAFSSLLMALLTFGVGFAMRPIGALYLGVLADRKGRKFALTVSNLLMTLGTAIIVFVPTYGSIGIAATCLLVLARLMQGFATGGETGVASVVLLELAPKESRCYVVGWRSVGQAGAALVGALVSAVSTHIFSVDDLHTWGWRVPFAIGLLIGPVGWYIRSRMIAPTTTEPGHLGLKAILAQHRHTIYLGILLMAAPSVGIYILVYYMPLYLVTSLQMPSTTSLLAACVSSAMICLVLPLVASIADHLSARKSVQYMSAFASILLAYPCFLLLQSGVGESTSIVVIGSYAALMLSSNAVTTVMILEAFPREHRATGVATIYSVGVTVFGAFCPSITTWLIAMTGDPVAPAWYLTAALAVSLYGLNRFPVVSKEG